MTPEARAEALVRTRSVPDGVYEGRERVLFVGDVRLDGEGGPFANPGLLGARGLIAALRAEVARVVREAEADLIPAAIKDEQPVDETRLEELRDPDLWDVMGGVATPNSIDRQAAELLSLIDYYRRLVVAMANDSGWQDGHDAGRRCGYREVLDLIHADREATRSAGEDPPVEVARLVKLPAARLHPEHAEDPR